MKHWAMLLTLFSITSVCLADSQQAPLPPLAVTALFAPVLPDAQNPALAAGKQINGENLESYRQWLDEPLQSLIKKGELTITLGPRLDFPTHPNYVEATEKHAGSTRIGEQPGELIGYHSGRPFSEELSSDDPHSGLKAAWNMRYTYAPDETETTSFIWHYRDMEKAKIERTLKMYGSILRYNHRHTTPPLPQLKHNPANLYSALYLRVSYPQDIRNTQLLIHRNEDDAKQEQAWLYMSSQRRVRRLATGQKTDAFLGSDIMIEDFLGYNGRIMDMDWKFIGTDYVLLPMYARNQLPQNAGKDSLEAIPFSGQGTCFPEVTWQLRKVYRVEAYPKDASHPLQKRHYLIDAATFTPALGRIYDKAGRLWKLSIVAMSHSAYHKPENQSWQGVITDAVSMIDLQARHCTTLQLESRMAAKPLKIQSFTPQYLRSMGR